jgi:hypothetical protein
MTIKKFYYLFALSAQIALLTGPSLVAQVTNATALGERTAFFSCRSRCSRALSGGSVVVGLIREVRSARPAAKSPGRNPSPGYSKAKGYAQFLKFLAHIALPSLLSTMRRAILLPAH